jgi:hypothetical protein
VEVRRRPHRWPPTRSERESRRASESHRGSDARGRHVCESISATPVHDSRHALTRALLVRVSRVNVPSGTCTLLLWEPRGCAAASSSMSREYQVLSVDNGESATGGAVATVKPSQQRPENEPGPARSWLQSPLVRCAPEHHFQLQTPSDGKHTFRQLGRCRSGTHRLPHLTGDKGKPHNRTVQLFSSTCFTATDMCV